MRKHRFTRYWSFIFLIAVNLQACSTIQQIIKVSPTSTLTETPTSTPKPTSTPTPTATPNLAATQYEIFFPLVQEQFDKGNIPSVNGTYYRLDDYSDSLADDEDVYQWSTIGMDVTNFIIKTHITMSTANKPSARTGCGIVFRVYDRNIDVVYVQQNGKASYIFNSYKMSAQFFGKVSNPAELNYVLIVNGKNVKLYIDGEQALVYDRSVEISGDIGFSVVTGSNEDYGSRCDFKDTELWLIKK